ncbi:MAG: CsbD family protein [Planctomycetota bacterium]|nr:CsbD family protein [Planctomycetota bacterium]
MSGTTDKVKGRIKEAAGALTDNNELREEGKTDQAVGKAKQLASAQKAVDEAKDSTKSCG